MSDRAYIATKKVRHVAAYQGNNWRSICRQGPEWDYRTDFDSFIWDVTPNYDDARWSLPVCKRCIATVDELYHAAHRPAVPVVAPTPAEGEVMKREIERLLVEYTEMAALWDAAAGEMAGGMAAAYRDVARDLRRLLLNHAAPTLADPKETTP
jgi:hypothetical protein